MPTENAAGTVLFPPRPKVSAGTEELTTAPPAGFSDMLESLCGGTDDSQPVEKYDGSLGVTRAFVDSRQGSVAQLHWNNDLRAKYRSPGDVNDVRWGTGTMISADLFLTAGHLFDQTGEGWTRPRDNTTGATIPPAEIAGNMHLNFNFQADASGNLRPEVRFPVIALVEYRLGGLDYAICRIGGSPGSTFGTSGVSDVDGAPGDMLCIMGHPAGVPKRVEAGPLTAFEGDTIKYNDIDTLGGNSGSGIFHAASGLLVGVHTNGGCDMSGGSNFGYRITSLRARSPILQGVPSPATAPVTPPGPQELRAQYEAALAQLGQAIQQRSGELVMLQQQYFQVLAEYQRLISGQNSS